MPNRPEWEGVQQQYKQALEKLLTADNDPVHEEEEEEHEEEKEIVDKVVESVAADEKSDMEAPSEISTKLTDENSASTAKDDQENDSKMADASDGNQKDILIVNLASHKSHRLTKNHKLSSYGFFLLLFGSYFL